MTGPDSQVAGIGPKAGPEIASSHLTVALYMAPAVTWGGDMGVDTPYACARASGDSSRLSSTWHAR